MRPRPDLAIALSKVLRQNGAKAKHRWYVPTPTEQLMAYEQCRDCGVLRNDRNEQTFCVFRSPLSELPLKDLQDKPTQEK